MLIFLDPMFSLGGLIVSFREDTACTWYMYHRVINSENSKNKIRASNRRGMVAEMIINLHSNVCSHHAWAVSPRHLKSKARWLKVISCSAAQRAIQMCGVGQNVTQSSPFHRLLGNFPGDC